MATLKPTDYIDEARRLADKKDKRAKLVRQDACSAQEFVGDVPVTVRLFAKATRLEQEAAVLRWLANYVEAHP